MPDDRVMGYSGHLSKSVRYFCSRTGILPEFAVPLPGLYDGNAAIVAIQSRNSYSHFRSEHAIPDNPAKV